MAESIKKKVFSGVAWTFVQNMAVKGLTFVISIFLTRLLSPGDFGLVGMLSIFIAISEVFILSGFGDALVQKKDCNDDDFSTAFYFNVAVAGLIYLLLFFAAPLIAAFYKEPQLVQLTRVLALSFVLGSLNIVQQSKLTRAMNFRPLAILSLVCTLVSGVVGVTMAYLGFGVWALVAQSLSSNVLRVMLFPFFTRWHPNRPFNQASFQYLWRYGSKLIVTGVVSVVTRNVSNILIGRFYDKEQTGYFTRSQSLAAVPSETMFSVLSTVTFPALCEVQTDQERWLSVYRKVLFNTVLIVCPVILLLTMLARPIVIILFTERWAACIPLLQALLLARMFLPIGATHNALLRSKGDTTLYMKLYVIPGPLSLIAVAVVIPFGVVAMAWATLVGELITYLIPAYVIGRRFGYPLGAQLWDWRLIVLSVALMCVGVFLSTHWLSSLWLQLIIGTAVGLGIYAACCRMFHLVDADLRGLILSKLPFKRKQAEV